MGLDIFAVTFAIFGIGLGYSLYKIQKKMGDY